jgi:aspartokinase
MSFMTQNNISDRVNSFLESNFVIRKCLFQNILSLRALSRHIIKVLNLKDGNLDAVISSIRRYKKITSYKENSKLKVFFSKIATKTRSNIVDIRVQKNKKSVENIGKLNSVVDIEKGEILRIIQAEQSITIIMDDKNLKKFNNIFTKSDCISIDNNLVEINLQFTEEAQNVKGIVAMVTSSLNAEGINLTEIMSSAPELLLIIKKDELLRCLNIVDNLHSLV